MSKKTVLLSLSAVALSLSLGSCALMGGSQSDASKGKVALPQDPNLARVVCGQDVYVPKDINKGLMKPDVLANILGCNFTMPPGMLIFYAGYRSETISDVQTGGGLVHGDVEAGKSYAVVPIIHTHGLLKADTLSFEVREVPVTTTAHDIREMIKVVKD